jgi:EAL domain-containing protein (putative c-di-GMP-specific phosphodiesterase class I)
MTERPEASTIVQTIVQLGHNLGLKVNAEGVESEKEFEVVAGFGCDIVQGHLISPPLPPADALRFLKAASANGRKAPGV